MPLCFEFAIWKSLFYGNIDVEIRDNYSDKLLNHLQRDDAITIIIIITISIIVIVLILVNTDWGNI